MNIIAIPAILGVTILLAGIFAFMPVEKASTVEAQIHIDNKHFTKHDFALLNNADTDVRCKSNKPMVVYITMTNDGADGVVVVEFFDSLGAFNDDFHFPIDAGETISMTHAARNTQTTPFSTPVADAEIRVHEEVGTGADLRGWISASTTAAASALFAGSFCITT